MKGFEINYDSKKIGDKIVLDLELKNISGENLEQISINLPKLSKAVKVQGKRKIKIPIIRSGTSSTISFEIKPKLKYIKENINPSITYKLKNNKETEEDVKSYSFLVDKEEILTKIKSGSILNNITSIDRVNNLIEIMTGIQNESNQLYFDAFCASLLKITPNLDKEIFPIDFMNKKIKKIRDLNNFSLQKKEFESIINQIKLIEGNLAISDFDRNFGEIYDLRDENLPDLIQTMNYIIETKNPTVIQKFCSKLGEKISYLERDEYSKNFIKKRCDIIAKSRKIDKQIETCNEVLWYAEGLQEAMNEIKEEEKKFEEEEKKDFVIFIINFFLPLSLKK